jgi:hypothetical protein
MLCCLAVMTLLVAGSVASQKSGIEQLDWISGCWISDDGKQRIEEGWSKPVGKSMIGYGRTVINGKTVSAEHLQIREVEGRGIAYIAAVSIGSKPVTFPLVKSSESEVVFENPAHDFPQRIIYRRESKDALFARIEGQEKGVNKAMDFRYKRASCN